MIDLNVVFKELSAANVSTSSAKDERSELTFISTPSVDGKKIISVNWEKLKLLAADVSYLVAKDYSEPGHSTSLLLALNTTHQKFWNALLAQVGAMPIDEITDELHSELIKEETETLYAKLLLSAAFLMLDEDEYRDEVVPAVREAQLYWVNYHEPHDKTEFWGAWG